MSHLLILWDESHIWGLLAQRAVQSLGFPYRLARAQEIAQGALSGKAVSALVVPGGVARRKAELLGTDGMAAIRDFVNRGGAYLGFCGGAGLGLSGEYGLGLCPWRRAAMTNRILHLVSGHLFVRRPLHDPANPDHPHPLVPADLPERPLTPVWWPARFEFEPRPDVEVLATYDATGPDFWVADLPRELIPKGAFSAWEEIYDLRIRPSTMFGQPCMATGAYGKGRYLLSYSHLETPESPEANRWLAHLLSALAFRGKRAPNATEVPRWELAKLPVVWDDPALLLGKKILDEIVQIGLDHFLLFHRNDWLYGWRAGIPGASLNNLYSLLRQALNCPPTDAAKVYLRVAARGFLECMELFRKEASNYLLAERLAMTLAHSFPETVSQTGLKRQRAALFGQAMEQGGLYAELLRVLDELVWRLMASEI
jgi:hypothetical protein